MKSRIVSFLLIVLMLCLVKAGHSSSGEIDAVTVCDWVVDGDTFDTTTKGRVRLADIDAPNSSQSGYLAAKNFLFILIYNKTVHLDIDDINKTDRYGRLVCVVYIKYNSTHFVNVNKALLVGGYAVIKDYKNNEFNPDTWTLYVHEDAIPEFPSFLILPLFIFVSLLAISGMAVINRWKKYRRGEPST